MQQDHQPTPSGTHNTSAIGIPRTERSGSKTSGFGNLLREWRASRGWSQLDLSLAANVSSRHVSFVETGRSRPSREMVHRLAEALDMPLRDRNLLLGAAGFVPAYGERPIESEDLAPIRSALEIILRRHDPYPAFVLDAEWNILLANTSHYRLLELSLGDPPTPANAIRLIFDPNLLRPRLRNFELVAHVVGHRIQRQLGSPSVTDRRRQGLEQLLAFPGVREAMTRQQLSSSDSILVPMELELGTKTLSWFSMIATLGTPLDVTLEELRIETLFPADQATANHIQRLLGGFEPASFSDPATPSTTDEAS